MLSSSPGRARLRQAMEPVFNNPWVFDSGATLADVLPDSPHFFVAPAVNLEKMRVPVSRTLLFILDLLFSIDEQHGVKSCGDLAHKCVLFLSSCKFPLNSLSHSSKTRLHFVALTLTTQMMPWPRPKTCHVGLFLEPRFPYTESNSHLDTLFFETLSPGIDQSLLKRAARARVTVDSHNVHSA